MSLYSAVLLLVVVAMSNGQLFPAGNGIGYRAPVYQGPNSAASAWGSVQPKPLVLGAGADWNHNRGHGLSVGAHHAPKPGLTQVTAGGQLGLVHTPQHQLFATGSHTKTFDNSFRQVGPPSNTAGLGYNFNSKDGTTSVGVQGSRTFTPGMKPQDQVMFGLTKKF